MLYTRARARDNHQNGGVESVNPQDRGIRPSEGTLQSPPFGVVSSTNVYS